MKTIALSDLSEYRNLQAEVQFYSIEKQTTKQRIVEHYLPEFRDVFADTKLEGHDCIICTDIKLGNQCVEFTFNENEEQTVIRVVYQ